MKTRDRILIGLCCILVGASALQVRADGECQHEFTTNVVPATCTTPGLYEVVCDHCGMYDQVENTPPLGHDWVNWHLADPPGCTKPGQKKRRCRRCEVTETHQIPPIHHDYLSEVVAPTCTKNGYVQYECRNCGDRYRGEETEAIGHDYDSGVLTKEPTITAMGRITYTCQNCGDTYQETVPKLTNPFDDVKPKNYFYNSVLWAYNMGITSGTDMTHFSPNQGCTRGQVMVFLWRYSGSPEPASGENPFADISGGEYYAKAVLWAYHQGITAGVDPSHFGPEQPCTRGQVVTFLYSLKGRPEYSDTYGFADVWSSDYYYDAVQWAAENHVTSGIGDGYFGPEEKCSRGQIVTFLYQARKL